jgi:Flp pilus assembly protein TadD
MVTLLPVIGIIQVGAHARADRYTYLPLIGLFIVAAWILPDGTRRVRQCLSWVLAGAVLVVCSVLSYFQTGYWESDSSLWGHALKVTRGNYVAENLYGLSLVEKGLKSEGLQHYRRAMALKPNFEPVYFNLAAFYQKEGRESEAIAYYRLFLTLDPTYTDAHINLATIFRAQKRYEEAAHHYREAIRQRPRDASLYNHLGIVLTEGGRLEEAFHAYDRHCDFTRKHAGVHNNIAMLLLRKGEKARAIDHFRKALAIQPLLCQCHYHLPWP